jgi:hypothetical protein
MPGTFKEPGIFFCLKETFAKLRGHPERSEGSPLNSSNRIGQILRQAQNEKFNGFAKASQKEKD